MMGAVKKVFEDSNDKDGEGSLTVKSKPTISMTSRNSVNLMSQNNSMPIID